MRYILLLLTAWCAEGVWAQPYHDNIWIAADGNDALIINFSSGSPIVEEADINFVLEGASASICDAEGNLAFYTNGCHVFDREHNVMENGIGLNPGEVYDDFCSLFGEFQRGYPGVPQSTVIIPWPNRDNQYLIFHQRISYNFDPNDDRGADFDNLFYSSVDMNGDQGLGRVVEKNISLDTALREQKIAVVKHANGIDWWLLNPLAENNIIQRYLIDSLGVSFVGEQQIGLIDDQRDRTADQYVFTPQGDKLLRFSIQKGLSIFDVDRFTGLLSNWQQIDFPQGEPDEFAFSGVGISPSGQYAYVSHVVDIYQYDLWADDIAASQYKIATIGNPDSLWLPPTGQLFQLGPDCKLYCYTVSGSAHHVIHQPDEPGDACGWEQGGLQLPFPVFRDQPIFPNFRLGPLGNEGSPCASPIVSNLQDFPPAETRQLTVFPNPVNHVLKYSSNSLLITEVKLYDGLGRLVRSSAERLLPGAVGQLSVSDLPNGIYFLSINRTGLGGAQFTPVPQIGLA